MPRLRRQTHGFNRPETVHSGFNEMQFCRMCFQCACIKDKLKIDRDLELDLWKCQGPEKSGRKKDVNYFTLNSQA